MIYDIDFFLHFFLVSSFLMSSWYGTAEKRLLQHPRVSWKLESPVPSPFCSWCCVVFIFPALTSTSFLSIVESCVLSRVCFGEDFQTSGKVCPKSKMEN